MEAYDAKDDASKSFAVAFGAIRERVAAGGPGWEPAPCQCPACAIPSQVAVGYISRDPVVYDTLDTESKSCGDECSPQFSINVNADERPLAIDLFCGMFGWSEGLIAEGWRTVGFDLEDMRGQFGEPRLPHTQLVIQDVLTLHGSQFRNTALIVASPPCQAYSYRAMPWKRAKALPPPSNELFEACFRIQREACEASGRHVPMVVENVRGAQKWVGRARWNFGSFYLWGDVPALMPLTIHAPKFILDDIKNGQRRQVAGVYENGIKCGAWFGPGVKSAMRNHSSKSSARKHASAMVAKIPLPLSRHIAATYHPRQNAACVHNDHS